MRLKTTSHERKSHSYGKETLGEAALDSELTTCRYCHITQCVGAQHRFVRLR